MIKKILATICAIGLVFVSCFVGHKIDSKAQSIGDYNNGDAWKQYNTLINSNYYFNAASYPLLHKDKNVLYNFDIWVRIDQTNNDGNQKLNYGDTLLFSYSAVNLEDMTLSYSYVVYDPFFDIKASYVNVPSTTPIQNLISWQNQTPYKNAWRSNKMTFTSQPLDNSNLNGLQITVAFSASSTSFSFSFDVPYRYYWIPSHNLYNVGLAPRSFVVYTDVHDITGNGVYSEEEYLNYGNQLYNQGQQLGYNKGYSAGISDGGNNSFLSLITAVVDAPINAFTSLLNFDILGFNVKNVVLSLLTAALVIACIRFFSGKFV